VTSSALRRLPKKKGDLVQRVTGNIADIEKLVTDGLVDLLAGILTLIGVAIIMLFISREYTVLSLAIAPLLFLIVSVYTGGIKAQEMASISVLWPLPLLVSTLER
jgi:ABC-type multidrug transport system fused ATPase/permease subunit